MRLSCLFRCCASHDPSSKSDSSRRTYTISSSDTDRAISEFSSSIVSPALPPTRENVAQVGLKPRNVERWVAKTATLAQGRELEPLNNCSFSSSLIPPPAASAGSARQRLLSMVKRSSNQTPSSSDHTEASLRVKQASRLVLHIQEEIGNRPPQSKSRSTAPVVQPKPATKKAPPARERSLMNILDRVLDPESKKSLQSKFDS